MELYDDARSVVISFSIYSHFNHVTYQICLQATYDHFAYSTTVVACRRSCFVGCHRPRSQWDPARGEVGYVGRALYANVQRKKCRLRLCQDASLDLISLFGASSESTIWYSQCFVLPFSKTDVIGLMSCTKRECFVSSYGSDAGIPYIVAPYIALQP